MNPVRRRLMAWIGALAALGMMIAGIPHQGALAAPAAAPSVLTVALPTMPDDYVVLAATGDWIWAILPADSAEEITSLSKDGGRTWRRLGVMPEHAYHIAGAGRLAYFGGDDGLGTPYFFYPTDLDNGDWGELWSVAAMGTKAVFATNGYLVRAGRATTKVTFAALPHGLSKPRHRYLFSSDSSYLVRITSTAGSADYASVVDVATATSLGRLTLARTAQHQVSGSAVYSLTGTRSGLRLCRQPLPSGAASCSTVVAGDQRKSAAKLFQFGASSLVAQGAGEAPLLVRDGTVTPVTLPAGTASWTRDGTGDPSHPLIRTVDATGYPHHLTVHADGSTSEYLAVGRVPVQVNSLALGATTVYGSHWDEDYNDVDWQRPVDAAGFGPLSPAAGRVWAVSGARRVVRVESGASYLYDGARRGRPVQSLWTLTGPYVLSGDEVQLVSGRKLATKRAEALFGSLVAEHITTPKGRKGYWLRVRDLAAASVKPVSLQLMGANSLYAPVQMWGDWLGTSVSYGSARVVNRRTGQVLTQPANLDYLGDGYAVLSDDDFRLSIWELATNRVTRLEKGSSSLLFGAYGNQVAYSDGTHLIVRTVAGVGTNSPRLLGALTSGKATRKAPWKASIDLTKPVAAGLLVIRDKAGRVVRTLATAASDTGSLRGISWSGRNSAGKQLKGRHTWELVAAAADGSGYAVAVSGDARASGTITAG